jgi:hypothetical protein
MVSSLISLLILVLVVGLVVWLALWAISELGIPDPFSRIARVLIVVIAVLIILYNALPLAGVSI